MHVAYGSRIGPKRLHIGVRMKTVKTPLVHSAACVCGKQCRLIINSAFERANKQSQEQLHQLCHFVINGPNKSMDALLVEEISQSHFGLIIKKRRLTFCWMEELACETVPGIITFAEDGEKTRGVVEKKTLGRSWMDGHRH